jgi:ribosomal protein L2
MNPVDHPHGGGRKSKGGKAARSPWGWLTKGPKTVKRKKWFVVVNLIYDNNRHEENKF